MAVTWLRVRLRKRPPAGGRDFRFPDVCANCGAPAPSRRVPLTARRSRGVVMFAALVHAEALVESLTTKYDNCVGVCAECHDFTTGRRLAESVAIWTWLLSAIPATLAIFALREGLGLAVEVCAVIAGAAWLLEGAWLLGRWLARYATVPEGRGALTTSIGIARVGLRKRLVRDLFREDTALYTLSLEACHPGFVRALLMANSGDCDAEVDEERLASIERELELARPL